MWKPSKIRHLPFGKKNEFFACRKTDRNIKSSVSHYQHYESSLRYFLSSGALNTQKSKRINVILEIKYSHDTIKCDKKRNESLQLWRLRIITPCQSVIKLFVDWFYKVLFGLQDQLWGWNSAIKLTFMLSFCRGRHFLTFPERFYCITVRSRSINTTINRLP